MVTMTIPKRCATHGGESAATIYFGAMAPGLQWPLLTL